MLRDQELPNYTTITQKLFLFQVNYVSPILYSFVHLCTTVASRKISVG